MRVKFHQGVPPECVDWLWENVGEGNINPRSTTNQGLHPGKIVASCGTDKWKYERIIVPKTPVAFDDDPFSYVPTITVYDEKQAMLFALRWA